MNLYNLISSIRRMRNMHLEGSRHSDSHISTLSLNTKLVLTFLTIYTMMLFKDRVFSIQKEVEKKFFLHPKEIRQKNVLATAAFTAR